jgi:hypothetical protein
MEELKVAAEFIFWLSLGSSIVLLGIPILMYEITERYIYKKSIEPMTLIPFMGLSLILCSGITCLIL